MIPRVFIGAASESAKYANELYELLRRRCRAELWDKDVFRSSRGTLQSLLEKLDNTDFGLFVFAPHDRAIIRGKRKTIVRDNVLFELGMFMGRFGPDRTAFLIPRGSKVHIPTDLLGIHSLTFDARRASRNRRLALEPACEDLLDALRAARLRDVNRLALTTKTLARLNAIGQWVSELQFEKSIEDWEYELHLQGDTVDRISSGLPGKFSTYDLRKCKYSVGVTDEPFSIGAAVGTTPFWERSLGNPAYIHRITTSSLDRAQRSALDHALHSMVRSPQGAWDALFSNVLIQMKRQEDEVWQSVTLTDPIASAGVVVRQFSAPACLNVRPGQRVALSIQFESVFPSDICSFTLEYPWLTMGCEARVFVHNISDNLRVVPHFFARAKPEIKEADEQVIVRSNDIVLPGSAIHIRWNSQMGGNVMNHIGGGRKGGGRKGGAKGSGRKSGGRKSAGRKARSRKGGTKKMGARKLRT